MASSIFTTRKYIFTAMKQFRFELQPQGEIDVLGNAEQ